jgi:hypothetical protein
VGRVIALVYTAGKFDGKIIIGNGKISVLGPRHTPAVTVFLGRARVVFVSPIMVYVFFYFVISAANTIVVNNPGYPQPAAG